MDNEFKITKEIMANATTYIPIVTKEILANTISRQCIKSTNAIMPIFGEDTQQAQSMDQYEPVFCESTMIKARFMMGILMSYYLHVIKDEEAPLFCSVEDYDLWAGNHVINQIERFKMGEYRETAFDILADYKEMERYVNAAIYAVLREKNDPVKRMIETLKTMFSAEEIQKMIDSMNESTKGIEEERERQEKIIHGEEGEERGG